MGNHLRITKCQLCGKYIRSKNALEIKNKINGNELTVCKKCAKHFKWI